MRNIVFILTLMIIGVCGVASAQETTGTITGQVVDAQGLAMPGVTVTVTGAQGTKS